MEENRLGEGLGIYMKSKKGLKALIFVVFLMVLAVGINKRIAFAADFSDAVNIQVNTPIGDSVQGGYNREQKYYRFTTIQSGSVIIRFFNPLQSNSECFWNVCLYNSEYEELFNMPVYGNKTNTDSIAVGIPAGAYYIKVTSGGWEDAMSADVYTIEADFTVTDMWEKEFNEDFTTSTMIGINSEYSGTTRGGYNQEKDYFKFQLGEAGYVTVEFSNPLQRDTEEYWKVYLYNSEYEELCNASIYGNKTSTELAATGLDVGTYYIKVESSRWGGYEDVSTDVYTINAKFVPSVVWEKEQNEDFTQATDISLETEYYGTTWAGYNYEKDYFRFSISKQGLYSIGITTPNLNNDSEYWSMYLYNSEYEELSKKTIYGNKTYHAISQTLQAGTYYIKVDSTAWEDAASKERYMLKVSPTNTAGVQATCDHEYEDYYVDATYFSKGYRFYTCEKCGYSYKGDYSAKKVLDQGYLSYSCSTGKGKLYLSWLTVWDATGYQIRYSTDKSFKSGVMIKNIIGQSSSTKTISKLSRKKKYYVQVRPYVKSGGKTAYGKWSGKKMLKTK